MLFIFFGLVATYAVSMQISSIVSKLTYLLLYTSIAFIFWVLTFSRSQYYDFKLFVLNVYFIAEFVLSF